MAQKIRIERSAHFERSYKKLKSNQRLDVEHTIYAILQNPSLGEQKLGDLINIRVYKFRMVGQLALLAYRYYDDKLLLELLKIGPHENFYKDLKNQIK